MEDTKKTVLAGNGEKDVPRAVYDGVLTIDVDAQVESMEEQEEARWHQLLNAHRTRKILTGQLGGIEKLESGWMVAVTYFNGFRIIIPMNEMMINLQGDGRENADTLNRQVRIANNMLGCDIDFIIICIDNSFLFSSFFAYNFFSCYFFRELFILYSISLLNVCFISNIFGYTFLLIFCKKTFLLFVVQKF